MTTPKYFKPVADVTDRSFMYKNCRVAIVRGIITTSDAPVIAALEASDAYEAVKAPVKAPAATAAKVDPAAAMLARGIAPKNSTADTVKVGISSAAALSAISKDSGK